MADDIGIQQEMLIEPTHKKLEIVDGHAVKDVEDYQNPELLYKSLIERVRKYHPSADVSMIEKAYHIARDAHKGQTRKSGEEYIIHPLWVGIILAQLEMDKETIVAGILHDVVEDTVMTDEEIRQEFGDEVALLVDGVTKLGQLSYSADKLDTGNDSSKPGYGDGNHNCMPADVDGDGKQEIILGSTCLDDNGKVLWCLNKGHGDALHVGDLLPERSGLEVWMSP